MRLLITGASGLLGVYLMRERAGHETIGWSGSRQEPLCGPLQPVDLSDPTQVESAFKAARPEVVIHAAALARVADCHRDPDRAQRINAGGTATLVRLAKEAGARLVLVSTDLVYDGEQAPYREEDPPTPVSVYGRSKVAAETAVLAEPGNLVVRVSLLYGPSLHGRPSFFDEQIAALRAGRPVTLFADEWRTPLDLLTAARALVGLAQSSCTGLIHVGGPLRLSRLEMGQRLAKYLGADESLLRPVSRDSIPGAESRPRDVSLDATRWRRLCPAVPWLLWDEGTRLMVPRVEKSRFRTDFT
jgi:dTDP-4-dehydrorhamnose reductase